MLRSKKMSIKLLHVVTLLALVLSLFGATAVGAAPAPQTDDNAPAKTSRGLEKTAIDANKSVRVIVQLADPPLVARGGAKLDVNSTASRAYLNYLTAAQTAFKADLAKVAPDARVDYSYKVAFNGLTVKVKGGQLDAIRALKGVANVAVEHEYTLDMDASLPLIGAGTGAVGGDDWVDAGLWAAVGGHANAGAGIKIADIDSGISYSNPCFDPTGYTYPAGFPKFGAGFDAFVNPKVIAAHAYFRADDPPKYAATPEDDAEFGHGSHTAGTMACNYGTATTDAFLGTEISGVAPKAQLMVYRVFYTAVSGSQSAWDPEILAAIDDMVMDGADVVNNSWGSTAIYGWDPLTVALSNAVDAGVTVVFSNGNNGPSAATAGAPGQGEKFISAGATTTNRVFAQVLNVTGPAPVPSNLTNLPAVPGSGPEGVFSGQFKHEASNALGCGAFTPGTFTGLIALIKRGTCTFSTKINNATAAGATAVVIVNSVGGFPTAMSAPGTTVPAYMVTLADGSNMINWVAANPAATLEVLTQPGRFIDNSTQDTLASFSSLGPTPDMRIKPDLMAPGVNILSAVSDTDFGLKQGTSMAAPHVTGAVALLKQLHPDWTWDQFRSALVTTAAQPATLSADPTVRGGGRLDLSHPNDPGLTFDLSSVSFGLTIVGETYTKTVTATDVSGLGGTYTVAAEAGTGTAVPVVPETLVVPAGGTASFDVVFTAEAAGVAYGEINLSDGTTNHTLHIPWWTRRIADMGTADVLLVDDDNSADECGPDYLSFYTQALDNLGLSYVVWEVTPPSYSIDFNQARRFGKVVYFTGDAGACSNLSTGTNANNMRNYLAQGGKMLITGQDIAIVDAMYAAALGTSFNPRLFFGAELVQDGIYAGAVPVPTMRGDFEYSTYLQDQYYDITPTGDGAGNQVSVDEIAAASDIDWDGFPILSSAPVTSTGAYGHLGTRMSSEPTIERVKGTALWTQFSYRTEFLSFGLEGVNNDTGFNTREELLDRLLSWMDDEVTVELTSPNTIVAAPYAAVHFTASAATSVVTTTTGFANSILYYRWDFGDGKPVQVTTLPETYHGFAAPGAYEVMVEAMDAFGHKAVSAQKFTVIPPLPDFSTSVKTVNKATASPEEKLTYSLTIKNTGTAAATDPWIIDPIPAGTAYVDGSVTGGAVYDAATNSIKWGGAGSLAIGDEHSISFKVQVLADTAVDTIINNVATFKDVRTNVSITKSATTTVVPQPVMTVAVIVDTYINKWVPASNYGNSGHMQVRAADIHAALLTFDLSALPAGATIKLANMTVYVDGRTNVGTTTVGAFQLLKPWSESQATWQRADAATMWEMAGANGASDRAATAAGTATFNRINAAYTFDVKSIAQNWANGAANVGIAIKYVSGDVMVAYNIASSENIEPAFWPTLTLQYVNP